MIWENIKQAFQSLRAAKMRAFLTMLGIIIGIGSVVAISSVGRGLQKEVAGQVNDLGANLVFVLPGQVLSEDGSGFNPSASVGTTTLTLKDLETIKKTDHVTLVTDFSLISGVAMRDQTAHPRAVFTAVTPSYAQVVESPKLGEGRFLAESDGSAFVAVLGSATRDALFGKDGSSVGEKISFRGKELEVIGVMESSGGGAFGSGSSQDEVVFISKKTAAEITGDEPPIYRIGFKVDSEDNVAATVKQIQQKLKDNHGGQEDFSVLTQKELLSAINTILDALTKGVAAIAGIALLVGGIGIMNIMLVSVTERTREIGIRKALGATKLTIMLQFLIEAAVLSLLGGGLGILAAYGIGNLAERFTQITPVFAPDVLAIVSGVSVGIGIIFGLAPAIKAARKRPIDALRYE